MTRGLHHDAHEPRSSAAPVSDTAASRGPAPPGTGGALSSHRPLRDALAKTMEGAPTWESTPLGRRARLLRIGVALEQCAGPEGYESTLRACEALVAGRTRRLIARPAPPNQLALPFDDAEPAGTSTAPPAPAPFRTRPTRRRWR